MDTPSGQTPSARKSPRSRAGKVCTQFKVLIWKNYIVSWRNWKGTLAQVLTPVLVCLLLFALQKISDHILVTKTVDDPPSVSTNALTPCHGVTRHKHDCTTVLYGPVVAQVKTYIDVLMERVQAKTQVSMAGLGPADVDEQYFDQHRNQTSVAVIFRSLPEDEDDPTKMPMDLKYTMFYNSTGNLEQPMQLKRVLDETIMQMARGSESAPSLFAQWRSYPTRPRFANFDAAAMQGGLWFFVPPMIIFFIVLTEVTTEKEARLRLGMRMMGMPNWVFWSTWAIHAAQFALASTLVLIASGYAFQFKFFTNTNFVVLVLTFFSFSWAMVSMAFFLSTLVAKTKTAQTVGYALILVGFVLQSILCGGFVFNIVDLLYSPDMDWWVYLIKYTLTLIPSFSFAKVYYDISSLASSSIDLVAAEIKPGPGFYFHDLFKRRMAHVNHEKFEMPSTMETMALLWLNALVFIVLTWYLDNVLPGEHGTALPPYFFLTAEYWGCGKSSNKAKIDKARRMQEARGEADGDDDVATETERACNGGEGHPLWVALLSKVYRRGLFGLPSKRDVFAVKSLSFTVEEGSIFCLLGHNGAGKTSALNILTGLFKPTGGVASAYGHSMMDEIDAVQDIMGVCPQHDILWKELTAREHLRLFGELKNNPGSEINDVVNEKLEEVGLLEVGNQRVGEFSGGMRRRLSVAISAVGRPKVIFMDEPTTGMDPVNRRAVWEMIEKMKADRAIVLTTHSMEEADVLGDKIGIMASGALRCVGTSLHLKNRFGDGYQFSLVCNPAIVDEAVAAVKEAIPSAAFVSNDAGNIKFNVPHEHLVSVFQFAYTLNPDGETEGSHGVREWGVSHTSLEDVFIAQTSKHFAYSEMGLHMADSGPEGDAAGGDTGAHDSTAKESSHGEEMQPLGESFKPPVRRKPRTLWALLLKNIHLQRRQCGTNLCQILTPLTVMALLLLLQVVVKTQMENDPITVATPPAPLRPGPHVGLKDSLCYESFSYTNSSDVSALIASMSGFFTCIVGKRHVQMPVYQHYSSKESMDNSLWDDLGRLNSMNIRQTGNSLFMPDGTFQFNEASPDTLDYVFQANDLVYYPYHRPNNFTRIYLPWIHTKNIWNKLSLTITEGRMSMMDMVHNAYIKSEPALAKTNLTITASLMAMPQTYTKDLQGTLELTGTFLYPLALTLQLPIYLYMIVMEKEERLRGFMKMNGMGMAKYWLVNYVFNMTLYICVVAFFWLTGFLMHLRFYSQNEPLLLLAFFLSWGHVMICASFLIGSILQAKRTASIIGYSVSLIGTVCALVVACEIYKLPASMPTWLLANAQLGLQRGIYLLNANCVSPSLLHCLTWADLTWDSEILRIIYSFHIDALVYFILALYFDQVIPQPVGVAKHPLFFLKCMCCGKKKRNNAPTSTELRQPLLTEDGGAEGDEDVDVAAERVRAARYDPGTDATAPLVVQGLRKEFSNGKKIAVDGLWLQVDNGECFGLLGPNGAGKTTTINMLTGVFPSTDGTAEVGGFNLDSDFEDVRRVIGVCPQFDILWDDLTVEEHLRFYARLKGVPLKGEREAVLTSMRSVGLQHCAHRLSKELSGGMKRRLSIAIAMSGDSKLIFLDEPTTGLDPVSRRHLWTIVERAKSGRAIVLTTHSMDEAEVLCGRIGIFASGRLRCVGSTLRLKNRFSSGYRLGVNYKLDKDKVVGFVKGLMPSAAVATDFPGALVFSIMPGDLHPDSFAVLERERGEVGITDWAVSQTTLEDVFCRIVADHQPDAPMD